MADSIWVAVLNAVGNYVYLQSEQGDYIGQGQTLTYTPAVAAISLSAVCNRLTIIVGNQTWRGDFQGMSGTIQLQPGYYGNLQRYPFHNPAYGGLSWSGGGRGCNTLTGWFVVDGVTYNSGTLGAIDLRFEQQPRGRHGRAPTDPLECRSLTRGARNGSDRRSRARGPTPRTPRPQR